MLDPRVKAGLQTIIFALLYILLFLILLPSLIRLMDEATGKVLYGILVAGALILALRLRSLARNLP